MPLTDTQCKKALPRERDYKLSDSGGLYLFVTSKGSKSWRLKYRFGGKEKLLTFGRYPDVRGAAALPATTIVREAGERAVEAATRAMEDRI